MAAHQAPPSLGFSRQEHWNGLPFPSPMHESESEVAQWQRIHLPMQDTQETQVQDDLLEKEMATHPSILAWKIPWTEEPGGLQSMGLQRVGYD